jgi:hypothetical protein
MRTDALGRQSVVFGITASEWKHNRAELAALEGESTVL